MTLILATKTFEANAEQPDYAKSFGWTTGTAEVTFQGKTHRVNVRKVNETEWVIFGLCGRYPTGGKVWPASVHLNHATGGVWVSLGFDSRSGRHGRPRLTGFLADVSTGHISKR